MYNTKDIQFVGKHDYDKENSLHDVSSKEGIIAFSSFYKIIGEPFCYHTEEV